MQFENPVVGGDTLIRNSIQSDNYSTGSSGWTVNRNGSAEFNNITIRSGEIVGGTQLYYSGTPGTGTLIASISDVQGTDEYGNVYFNGICSYNAAENNYVQLREGQLLAGLMTDTFTESASLGYGEINNTERGVYPCVSFVAPTDGNYAYNSAIFATPGSDNSWTNAPRIYLVEQHGNTKLNATISGSLQTSDLFGNVLKTVTVGSTGAPSFTTGWQTATTYASIGACESLQYALLPDGRIHLHGAFSAGSSAPSLNAVFGLPSGYHRTDRVTLMRWQGLIGNTGNEVHGTGSIMTNGNVSLSSTNTTSSSPRVANSVYWIDTIFDGPDVQ